MPDNTQYQAVEFVVPSDTDMDSIPQGTKSTGANPESYYRGVASSINTFADGRSSFPQSKNNPYDLLKKIGNSARTVPDIDDIGSKYCVAVGIRQTTSEDNSWNISNPSCRTIAKKPATHILGGNIMSAGNITVSGTQKVPNYDDRQPIKFGKWGSLGREEAFRSWTEHLAIGRGENSVISGLASGAFQDLSLGITDRQMSPLTISNRYDQMGQAAITGRTFLDKIKELDLSKFRTIKTNNLDGYTIDCGSDDECKNETVVVRPPDDGDKTVTIRGDIFNRSHGMTKFSSMPQILVVADNINIDNNVSQVDAWLLAADGAVNTCTGFEIGPSSAASCGNGLTVNGLIAAKKVDFNRTAGAGRGRASGDPAEQINMSLSTYQWLYSTNTERTSRAVDAYSRELAPRL